MTLALVTATDFEMRCCLAGACGPGGPGGTCGVGGASGPGGAGDPAGRALVPRRGVRAATLAGRTVLLVVTGVGPVNAALEIGAALEAHPEIRGVVNLGIAGSFDLARADLGAVVAATSESWPEYGLAGEDGVADARAIGFPQLQADGQDVWDTLELAPRAQAQAMGLRLPEAWALGPSLTVAGVTATPARARRLVQRFSALTENMEGFSLALACRARGLAFLEVRTISNQVAQRDKSQWKTKAALSGLGQVLAVLLGLDQVLPEDNILRNQTPQ